MMHTPLMPHNQKLFWGCTLALLLHVIFHASNLFHVGWNSVSGAGFMKIHPGSYLMVLLVGYIGVFYWKMFRLEYVRTYMPAPVQGYLLCWLAVVAFLVLYHGGGAIAFMVESLLMPALALLVVSHLPSVYQVRLFQILLAVLLGNAALGIAEQALGFRVLPLVIGAKELGYQGRATALLGHPLDNAYAMALAALVILDTLRHKVWMVAALLLLLVSMFAFGGRTALGVLLLMLMVYGVLRFYFSSRQKTLQLPLLALAIIAFFLLFAGAAFVLLGTNIGAQFMERLTWDSSAESRFQQLEIFQRLSTREILLGISDRTFEYWIEYFGLLTMENSWAAYVLRFGLIFFIIFATGLAALLRYAWQYAPLLSVRLAVPFFIILAAANNLIVSKSSALTLLVVLMVTAGAYHRFYTARLRR